MMNFAREFDRITMVFFDSNFMFNQARVKMDSVESKNKLTKVVEIISSSYSKVNLCYISVTHGKKSEFGESGLL